MILELIWIALLSVAVLPVAFYLLFMLRVGKAKSWNVEIDSNYEPVVSFLIPTFEEESSIVKKLDNITEIDYPKDKTNIIVVDSASKDNTVNLVSKWIQEHPAAKAQVVVESQRRGMVAAMNYGLSYIASEVLVKTDADCLLRPNSLRNAVKYLADPRVGAVAGQQSLDVVKDSLAVSTEKMYRGFYNLVRVGESKLWSSVLFEGEFMMLKTEVIKRIRFDEEIGADDLPTAIRLVKNGYRALVADDAFFIERTPHSLREKFRQKVRRGRHLLQGLWKYRQEAFKQKTVFHKFLLPFEMYMYMLSPGLSISLLVLTVPLLWLYPYLLLMALLLVHPKIRDLCFTYLVNISIMFVSLLMEIGTREKVTWDKSDEIR
ncbi:MAG: glycosyltransferase [Candidatus Bathyarchaeia archaeon]